MAKTLVIYGSATCGYCKRFKPLWQAAEFTKYAASNGITIVEANQGTAAWTKWRSKAGISTMSQFPVVALFDGNTRLGYFVGRTQVKPFTAAGLVKLVKTLCKDCGETDNGPKYKDCPTCGGTGKVLATLALLLAGLAVGGCTNTRFENLDGGGFKMTRTSFLQKVEVPNVTVLADGSVSIDGYSNDGGNEATAKLVEAALKIGAAGAAAAAVP